MVNQILHYLHAKQMYDMQKNQGMAGLVGILSVLLIVWKWNDWFYPVLDSLGLVAFAERTGMLHPDMPVMSVINVVAVIVFLMLLVTVSAFLYLIGIMFLAVFAQSKIGALILGITLLPFFYIFSILNRILTYPMRVLKERQREKEWQIESAAYFKRLDRQNGDHIQDPIFRKWIDEIHDKYGKNNLTRAMIYAQRRKELKLECDVIVESTKEEIEKILCRMSPDFFSEDTRFMLLFTPSNNPNIIDLLHALLPSPNPGCLALKEILVAG
ncbi:hypothetical protein [Mangrovibacillus cuniculi]|uniref:Uncharacterized protein n=1 Tax=Mangrovibacillus cuniculi TaxID=2593652 RepID=A0A7S8CCP5_9BACI|nr:hypothetical protein [Mangrovibacillus cuniculi]QPC47551.1 hypothetical protein G8O30_11615 [Mangrovibacillus cuniculi]